MAARSFMSGEEKLFLKEIITRHASIVESKKTDAVSVTEKKKVWLAIAKEFNSVAEHSKRAPEQLRKCWENMKSRRKKELSSEKQQRMKTGGGSYKPPEEDNTFMDDILTAVDIELKDSIDSDTITILSGGSSSFNNDHDYVIQEDASLMPVLIEEDAADSDVIGTENKISKVAAQNPTPRRTPRRNVTYTSRGTAIERELERRLERTDALLRQDEELHALRIQEQHLKLAIAQEQLKQEKLKTEMLQKQLENK